MIGGDPPRVGVVGGGSAGYMAALALRARRPDVAVTLIQSSRVPIIGVGESTTPVMVAFLHGYLGLDVENFMAHVRPTWKLGVKLLWGQPGEYFFNFPFDAHGVCDSYVHTGDINSVLSGRGSCLRAQDLTCSGPTGAISPCCLSCPTPTTSTTGGSLRT